MINLISTGWQKFKKPIYIILAVAAFIGIGYAIANGAYHTYSNLNWRANQAANQGYSIGYQQAVKDLNDQILHDEATCGGAVEFFTSAKGPGIICGR